MLRFTFQKCISLPLLPEQNLQLTLERFFQLQSSSAFLQPKANLPIWSPPWSTRSIRRMLSLLKSPWILQNRKTSLEKYPYVNSFSWQQIPHSKNPNGYLSTRPKMFCHKAFLMVSSLEYLSRTKPVSVLKLVSNRKMCSNDRRIGNAGQFPEPSVDPPVPEEEAAPA